MVQQKLAELSEKRFDWWLSWWFLFSPSRLYVWINLDSLVAVLFGAREGLGVDMSQGDVLVPLEVSHQNADLWLHQTNPEGKTSQRGAIFSINRLLVGTLVLWVGYWLTSLQYYSTVSRLGCMSSSFSGEEIHTIKHSGRLHQNRCSLNTVKIESGWLHLTDLLALTILSGFPLWMHWPSERCNVYGTKQKIRQMWNFPKWRVAKTLLTSYDESNLLKPKREKRKRGKMCRSIVFFSSLLSKIFHPEIL